MEAQGLKWVPISAVHSWCDFMSHYMYLSLSFLIFTMG